MNTDIQRQWFYIDDIAEIDSPALVIYRERIAENIKTAISMVGDIERLRPHVKTHKALEVTKMLMDAGIFKFKCATIAEAEMLAMAAAKDVLLAYQPVGPKLKRFIELIKKYPATKFSCLVDNLDSAKNIGAEAGINNITLPVYLDLNVGMNRTGIDTGDKAIKLYRDCKLINGIEPKGFHVYDGHIRNTDIAERTAECDKSFEPVLQMQKILKEDGFPEPIIIAGGSPTFPVHAKKKDRECSPGTFVYWDKSYEQFEEQKFLPAALVICRVISFPSPAKLCVDLGHKSIAAENSLDKRVYFLNAPELKFVSQSEEHLVAEVPADHSYKIGDVLYGIPFHICPTVALYERSLIIEKNKMVGEWKTIARDRKINI
jgi:D-serine deaminase-like pyridoxal phosphate-dependent protein